MSGNNKSKRPLVAENRYGKRAAKPGPAKKARKAAPKKSARKATRKTRRPGLIGFIAAFIGGIFRALWRLVFGGAAIVGIMIGIGIFYFAAQMPPVETVIDGRARGSVTLADYQGEVFAWRGDQFGGVITTNTVSPHLVNAVVAQEDKRFYSHFGISPRGIASAVRINLRAGRGPLSGYFGTPPSALSPAEAAMLTSVLPAPSARAPTRDLEAAQRRASVVLGLMEAQGRLSPAEAIFARENPATLSRAAKQDAGGFFADWVMSSVPAFLTRDTTADVKIRTTFDQGIQTAAEDALAWVFENKVRAGSQAEAAVVVMSADGAVRAMVGGRADPNPGDFNRAIQARRQPGSAFKPFVFAAALELDFSPNDFVDDSNRCWTTPGSGEWCPKNYDREFKGPVSLTQSLRESRNVPAVILSEFVGRDIVRDVANRFGIESDLADGPALALGVSESTLLEMTGAYAGILNGGSAADAST